MQNPITKKSQQGFTLIELLIVVAIIGILAAIAIPQYAQYRTSAMNSAAQSELKNVQTSLEGYYTTQGYAYPEHSSPTTVSSMTDLDFSPSEEVTVRYQSPSNQTFEICSYHDGGDKMYGVNSTLGGIQEVKCSSAGGSYTDAGSCDGCGFPSDGVY